MVKSLKSQSQSQANKPFENSGLTTIKEPYPIYKRFILQNEQSNSRIGESLSQYQFYIGAIFLLVGLLTGTLISFLLLRKVYIAIGIAILLSGISYLLKVEWKYWSWKETVSPYLIYGPFLTGFGITITIFTLTREVI